MEEVRQFPESPADISPETSIRIIDQAIVDWVSELRFRRQKPNVVTAWMSKQYSQKKELQDDKTQNTAMPFPMISVSVGSITPDISRRNTNRVLTTKNGRIYADNTRNEYLSVPWPLPVSIPYQIDIWTKKRQDLRLIETAILTRFPYSDTTYIQATFPGYGQLIMRLVLDRVDDTSDLETGESERELRKTISTTLDGWIFLVPEKGKVIKKGHAVFIDATGGLIGDQSFLDHYCDLTNYNFGDEFDSIISIDESPSHIPPNRVLLWASFDETGLTGTGSQV